MKRAAQSTLEYMVMIAAIVVALAAMTVYTKRSLQGRIRAGADQVSSEGAYMPGGMIGESVSSVERNINESSASRVDKTGGKRNSVSETNVNITQITNRNETVGVAPGGG